MTRRRLAVIGSGVAGLTAAYILQDCADITLYEADDRLGGHAHTHDIAAAGGRVLAIDTGFIVHNERTYPHLRRLFTELGVATQESDMSMSIACDGCGLEYAGGRGLSGILPSVNAASNPRYLRMLTEIVRFQRRARKLISDDNDTETVSEFLIRGRFSAYFVSHFMTPLISAVWSCAPNQAGNYPAKYLFVFLSNHGMLSITGAPIWRTVVGGSARYVEKAVKGLSAISTSTPVRSVLRIGDRVEVRDDGDTLQAFDGAVIATHPDQALRMLPRPTAEQAAVLGAIPYTRNPTMLHTDRSVLPRQVRARASWNYRLPGCAALPAAVHVSYDMNRLQRLDCDEQYIVTLNGAADVDPDQVVDRMVYEHPLYTRESVAARGRLPELSDGTLAFAGAYHGWGFHEDGCQSGVVAAAKLGGHW